MTNYERIVSKSPLELADWLCEVITYCDNHYPFAKCPEACPMYECCIVHPSDNIYDWIIEEAKQ